ncbi:hypothetical protein [Haloimpatiens lingqiaonensis]
MLKINILSNKGDKINIVLPIKVAKIIFKCKDENTKLNNSSYLDIGKSKDIDSKTVNKIIIAAIKKGTVGKIIDLKSHQEDIIEIKIE